MVGWKSRQFKKKMLNEFLDVQWILSETFRIMHLISDASRWSLHPQGSWRGEKSWEKTQMNKVLPNVWLKRFRLRSLTSISWSRSSRQLQQNFREICNTLLVFEWLIESFRPNSWDVLLSSINFMFNNKFKQKLRWDFVQKFCPKVLTFLRPLLSLLLFPFRFYFCKTEASDKFYERLVKSIILMPSTTLQLLLRDF